MTRARKIIFGVAVVVVGVAGWIAHGMYYMVSRIPEAYAAWDTGTLLVEYLKANDDRWPTSWPDLLTVLDPKSDREIILRASNGNNMKYAKSLGYSVAVDWHFDPVHPGDKHPVTRLDGTAFPVMWEDPNEMVENYRKERAATRPIQAK